MFKQILRGLIAVFGLIYIFVIPSEPTGVKLVFKMIPMALIITYALLQMPAQKHKTHWIVLGGLLFSAGGDALLGAHFVVGLGSFLIGHLFYMNAFFQRWRAGAARFWTLLPLVAFGIGMGLLFTRALIGGPEAEFLAPVLAYIAVILTMTWSAIMTGQRWLILGSLLFTFSDAVLAWDLFMNPVTYAAALVMVPYYSAQFFIAHGLAGLTGPAGEAPGPAAAAGG